MISLILTVWGLAALMMLVLWLVQAKTKNASFVDLGWTWGLVVSVWVYASNTGDVNARKVMIVLLVSLWGLRLTYLLVTRLIQDPREDSRYAKIRADWKTHQNFKFFFMFQFQALVDVILSWGFLLICLNPAGEVSFLEYLAVGIWAAGFIGESLADAQLKAFKGDPANKGKTCQDGLWNYSRHPNYFCEWLMWVAYFLMAVSASSWGWTAIVMPALMYYFLMHVSGVPLAEAQSLKTKGEDYRRYQATTSMFVPLPKRKI